MRLHWVKLLASAMILAPVAVEAQNFPAKTIRIVASSSGGGTDVSSRLIAQGLAARLGKPVVVENRGGNMVATDIVIDASPDGYTLTVNGNPLWLARFLHPDLPYDPMKDLTPVTMATRSPYILVVHPSVAAKSVPELIALAKARPGQLNYAHGVGAGTPQLAAELFKSMTRADIVPIAYRGTAGAVNGVIGGEVQLMFASAAVFSHVKAGRLRGLAVTSAEHTPLVPGLPSMASFGLAGYEAESTLAVFAPAKTPQAIITLLNQASVATLNDPDIKQKFLDMGRETIAGTTTEAIAAIKSEMGRMGKVIRDAGIRE